MPHDRPRPTGRLRWTVRIVLLGLIVYGVWQLFGLHANDAPHQAKPQKAEAYTGVPLPPEARNVRVAGYRQWIEFAHYVRFEAPPDVCLKYAAAVVPGHPLAPVDEFRLEPDARPLREGVFRDFSWFDLHAAKNVVGAGGRSSRPQVWVDQDRGIFYFRRTD